MRGRIYAITCLKTNKLYFGQTIKEISERFAEHVREAARGSRFKLHKAIRKYGSQNFHAEEVLWVEASTKSLLKGKLDMLEIYFIGKYSTKIAGYNMTDGGEGRLGCTLSEETKLKIAKSNECKTRSPETRRKISEAYKRRTHHPREGSKLSEFHKQILVKTHLGISRSLETRMKISASNKGRVVSEETRRKISAACQGRKISDEQRKRHSEKMKGWVPTKDWRNKHSRKIIEFSNDLDKIYFDSIKEVCLKLGVGRKTLKRIIANNKVVNGKRYMYEETN